MNKSRNTIAFIVSGLIGFYLGACGSDRAGMPPPVRSSKPLVPASFAVDSPYDVDALDGRVYVLAKDGAVFDTSATPPKVVLKSSGAWVGREFNRRFLMVSPTEAWITSSETIRIVTPGGEQIIGTFDAEARGMVHRPISSFLGAAHGSANNAWLVAATNDWHAVDTNVLCHYTGTWDCQDAPEQLHGPLQSANPTMAMLDEELFVYSARATTLWRINANRDVVSLGLPADVSDCARVLGSDGEHIYILGATCFPDRTAVYAVDRDGTAMSLDLPGAPFRFATNGLGRAWFLSFETGAYDARCENPLNPCGTLEPWTQYVVTAHQGHMSAEAGHHTAPGYFTIDPEGPPLVIPNADAGVVLVTQDAAFTTAP